MKHDTIIFHIDVNSAFLSWEANYRINHLHEKVDLRTIPSAVGGNKETRHGIILAASISAKKCGIKTGEPVGMAIEKCPNLTIVKPHYNLYQRCSDQLINYIREYAPRIEVYSVDEAWADMTGTVQLYGSPIELAHYLKDTIYHKFGFTVNIGISNNKLLAKMASDFKKPNMVHTCFPEEIEKKLWPLPVGDLFFVGPATKKKLRNLDIQTIGQLANTDINILRSIFKSHGEVIWSYANGHDLMSFEEIPPANKGYGNSMTTPSNVTDPDEAKHILLSLCETVGTRLRKDNVYASVISVSIKSYEYRTQSHQMKLLSPTNITNELHHYACILFDELWDKDPIRHLGVHTSQISGHDTRQLNLFDQDKYEKHAVLDRAIDTIRNRYGNNSIMRCRFLNSRYNHMAGGITPDKNGETEYKGSDDSCKKLFQ